MSKLAITAASRTIIISRGAESPALKVVKDVPRVIGDTAPQTLTLRNKATGEGIDVSSYSSFTLIFQRDGGLPQTISGTAEDAANGILTFAFDGTEFDIPGIYHAEAVIVDSDSKSETYQGFQFVVRADRG